MAKVLVFLWQTTYTASDILNKKQIVGVDYVHSKSKSAHSLKSILSSKQRIINFSVNHSAGTAGRNGEQPGHPAIVLCG